MKLTIDENDRGKRLDQFVLALYPALSRAFIKRLIEDGKITVNQEVLKSGHRLRIGQIVDIQFDPVELEQIESIDLPVLYEDDDVLVVDKPSGVISHARGKFWNEPSVASFVRERSGQVGERAGIVHRLDRATSGVMICAKNSQALKFLQRQFADRTVEKTYIAIIRGTLDPPKAIIDVALARNPAKPQTFMADPNGKSAVTTYEITKDNGVYSEVTMLPKTGRSHQLRVHLHYVGHPIVGDLLYGGEPAERLLLHAASLRITLPSGETKLFEAPLPAAFNTIMKSEKMHA
ncbi:MAG: RluA family pseudouridine synthase [Candidatus Saccharibacteria bacterium]|nr:RluA family pseudouridine synthase [Candidatus Saccharibacteria bacterium]